ncbi:HD domain-containing protein [Candidatus Daviesbacteria bacterium]|nr:HD domain-containing protein [Candidatus Daviesbacteria bacterium]
MSPDAKKILKFIEEIDQFKFVTRIIHMQKGDLMEDDAQHSWHLAMMVWLFAEQFDKKINLIKVIKMALMHDLVEIYAGDTFAYDEEARKDKKKREDMAAKKLFKMLPKNLEQEMHQLWQEYEERKSSEAVFVQALDKIHPMIQVYLAKGKTWSEYKITGKMIKENKSYYTKSSHFAHSLFTHIFKKAQRAKYFFEG